MNILNFYYIMMFHLSKVIPKHLESQYSFVFNLMVIVMKRPKESPYSYSRYYLYDAFKTLDRALAKFLATNDLDLNSEHKALIRDLINLTQNLNRFFRFSDPSKYPAIIEDLTVEGLQNYTKTETTKRRTLRGPFEVTFLKTDVYLKLAKKLEAEAFKLLN